MPDFNAKMHQNRFRLELRPQTPLGELTALPRPTSLVFPLPSVYLLAGFKGAYFKGKGVGRRGEGRGGQGRGGGARPVCLLVLTILATGLMYSGNDRVVTDRPIFSVAVTALR